MAVPPPTARAGVEAPPGGLRAAALFAVLAIAVTWVVWIPRALARDDDGAVVALGNAWTYGPAVAAVLAAALTTGRAGLRELGRRLTRWRVGPVWWAVVLLGPAALWLVVLGVHVALGGSADEARPLAVEAGAAAVVPLLLVLCLTDGLGEETGWRGFALPRLLERLGPVPASLLLGVLWAVWHLPLYWTEGVPLHRSALLLLFVELPVYAVIYTWVFLRTGGSALLAVVLHAASNLFTMPLPGPGDGGWRPYLLLLGARAALVVALLAAGRRSGLRG